MSQGRERHRARNVLVVAQVGLALVLLIGSGLMIRTFQALRSIQPGFTHPEQVQLLRISIPETQVKEPERVMRIENEMIDKLSAIPGVTSAALASAAPLERINNQNDLLYAQDKTYSPGQIPPIRAFRYISPGFLKTDGTPLIAGRDFAWTDVYDLRHVAIVSENMARELWGSPAAALGKQVRTGLQNDAWREIVAVVGDVYDNGPEQKAPAIRIPFPRRERKLPLILSREEVKALLEAPRHLRQRTLLAVLYGSGLRVSEVTQLKASDIDSARL